MVQSQPRQIVQETLSPKNPSQKRAGGVAQGVGPEFKHQYHKKKKKICFCREIQVCNLNLFLQIKILCVKPGGSCFLSPTTLD
jgi:hypothetical protein